MTDRTTGMTGGAGLRMMRMIVATYLAVIPLMGVVMAFVVPAEDPWGMPDVLGLALPVVVGVAAWAGIVTVGLRVPPLPASHVEVAPGAGASVYQSTMFVRMALATAPALVSIALLFALPHATMITFAIGAVISLALLAVYAYPNRYNARLVERRLDSAGARSRLAEGFVLGRSPEAPSGYSGSATFH